MICLSVCLADRKMDGWVDGCPELNRVDGESRYVNFVVCGQLCHWLLGVWVRLDLKRKPSP